MEKVDSETFDQGLLQNIGGGHEDKLKEEKKRYN